MNKLFSTLWSAIKARVQPLVTKLRFLTTPAFWTSTIFTKIRQFLSKLLDVKPKHKKDYYTIGRWMISKRLAFALVIALGIACTMYIYSTMPARAAKDSQSSAPTYKYNSIPLKFYSGNVNILAKDGHLAYTGPVSEGTVTGKGKLFDFEGNTLYEGEFDKNLFNGDGQLFYPEGGLRYQGSFADNLFHGTGAYFRLSGTLEYDGEHVLGKRSGHGKLYNGAGTQIFEGSFRNDSIVYSELMDKSTADISAMYTGTSKIYSSTDEFCVTMDEIGAVYSAKDGSSSLDGQWSVGTIYILSDSASIGNADYKTIAELTKLMGAADYFGTAWVDLPEAVCINALVEQGNEALQKIDLSLTADLDEVFTVNSYNKNATVYLYSFIHDGLLYTFYCPRAGSNEFFMYSIEIAK